MSAHMVNIQMDNAYERGIHVCSIKMYGVMMIKCVYHLIPTHKYDINVMGKYNNTSNTIQFYSQYHMNYMPKI
jgi:hypothetical protein